MSETNLSLADSVEGENNESDSDSYDDGVSETNTSRSRTPTRAAKRGRRRKNAKKLKKNSAPYKFGSQFQEPHKQPIFGIAFNNFLEGNSIFATCGSNCATVYKCTTDNGLKRMACFRDPDPDEVFYSCAWSVHPENNECLLAVGGYRGVLRVLHTEKFEVYANIVGHGAAINEVKFHPKIRQLLLSGSKDHSIRLWNIQTHVCIAIFGGVDGHRDEVLSIDFDAQGHRIASAGMDHSLKLWDISTELFQETIEKSHNYQVGRSRRPFPTIMQHYPHFSTRDVHRNYVDCVFWANNHLFSKACENAIVCWKPGRLQQTFGELKPNDHSVSILADFEYDYCDMWFVRFAFSFRHHIMAIGNQYGKVYIYEMDVTDPENTRKTHIHHPKSTSLIRQVAFNKDASIMIYVCDDGHVWRFNKKTTTARPSDDKAKIRRLSS